jgi:hypothetical protein
MIKANLVTSWAAALQPDTQSNRSHCQHNRAKDEGPMKFVERDPLIEWEEDKDQNANVPKNLP